MEKWDIGTMDIWDSMGQSHGKCWWDVVGCDPAHTRKAYDVLGWKKEGFEMTLSLQDGLDFCQGR